MTIGLSIVDQKTASTEADSQRVRSSTRKLKVLHISSKSASDWENSGCSKSMFRFGSNTLAVPVDNLGEGGRSSMHSLFRRPPKSYCRAACAMESRAAVLDSARWS